MMNNNWIELRKKLLSAGVEFAPGLSEQELAAVEARYDLVFPRAWREFYRVGLPVGGRFPDWRDDSEGNLAKIRRSLESPLHGVLFDVEKNDFWLPSWGEMPAEMADRLALCREKMACAPRLIPVYGHRYIPMVEGIDDPPVLSVVQTDIIFYGDSLENYMNNDFLRKGEKLSVKVGSIGSIPVWDEIMGRDYGSAEMSADQLREKILELCGEMVPALEDHTKQAWHRILHRQQVMMAEQVGQNSALAREVLSPLLGDERPMVRLTAAVLCIHQNVEIPAGRSVLQRLAEGGDWLSKYARRMMVEQGWADFSTLG